MSCPEDVCRFLGGPAPPCQRPSSGTGLLSYFTGRCWHVGLFAACPLQQCLSFAHYLLCFALPQLTPHRRDGARPALGMPIVCFFFFFRSANSFKPLSFERAGVGKELFRLQQRKKEVFPKSNIYAMRVPWWELHILPWGSACRESSQRPGCLES